MEQKTLYDGIAMRLGTYRKARGLTQKQVAEKVGVNYKTLDQWETGNRGRHIKIDDLVRIAEFYGVSLDVLCGLPVRNEEKEKAAYAAKVTGLSEKAIEMLVAELKLENVKEEQYFEEYDEVRPEDFNKINVLDRILANYHDLFYDNFLFYIRNAIDMGGSFSVEKRKQNGLAIMMDDETPLFLGAEASAQFFIGLALDRMRDIINDIVDLDSKKAIDEEYYQKHKKLYGGGYQVKL